MPYSIDLSGNVAIVTGGVTGLGLAITAILAGAGAQVVMDDIITPEDATPFLEVLSSCDPVPVHLRYDIGGEEECKALVAETVSRFGRVDIVVNNAAIARKPWHKVFDVNVLAQFYLNSAACEDMKKRQYGKIVNVTTSGVASGGGDGIEYNATKGAADSMTRYLGKRYARDGVNVNAVAPGPTLTDMMRGYYGEEKFHDHYLPTMPIGRVLIPEDLAKVVLFLCSPLSDAVCGESILADGGRARLNPA
ncbi:MAG: SDR family oxidoreductase [Synergistaceae bacterium]|jgi:NAD(P)-dependent dehydrogenase (short-subunit alcohol dehydrogenase family)|nr:SDR family oxidoreductase [Synergistaceae bacterium]